jgi:hypothetical protein
LVQVLKFGLVKRSPGWDLEDEAVSNPKAHV